MVNGANGYSRYYTPRYIKFLLSGLYKGGLTTRMLHNRAFFHGSRHRAEKVCVRLYQSRDIPIQLSEAFETIHSFSHPLSTIWVAHGGTTRGTMSHRRSYDNKTGGKNRRSRLSQLIYVVYVLNMYLLSKQRSEFPGTPRFLFQCG